MLFSAASRPGLLKYFRTSEDVQPQQLLTEREVDKEGTSRDISMSEEVVRSSESESDGEFSGTDIVFVMLEKQQHLPSIYPLAVLVVFLVLVEILTILILRMI